MVIPSEVHYLQPTVDSQDEGEVSVDQGTPRQQSTDSDTASVSSTLDGLQLMSEGRDLVCPQSIADKDPYLAFNST